MQTTEEEKPKRYTPSRRKAAAAAPAVEVKETPAKDAPKPKRGLNEILHDLDRDVFGDDEEDEDGGGEE